MTEKEKQMLYGSINTQAASAPVTYNFEPQVPNQYIDDFKHDINYTLENPGHIYAVDTYSPPVQQNDTAPQMALGQSDSSASSAHKQWFGDHQTIPEMLAALSQNTALSLEQKDQLYKQVLALTNDPSTPYYNKYSAPTSDAVKYIAKLGIDVSGGVNDAWLEKNKYLLNYGLYTATGTTPSKPSGSVNSSNIMQWLAYDYAQIAKDYKATQAVSTEIAALKDEIAFKANRADRNMSDQEIMDSIDWAGKYKNLNKIKEGADTGFVGNYTSALDFDFDYLPVYIWQARNNGGTGDALVDGIKAALGQGNQWQENAQIANELDPNSENYKPFSHGSTLDADDLIRMGGVSEITPGMVADLKAKTDWNNDADVKFYNKVAAAEANTEKAEAQLQEFNQRIDAMLYLGGITDPAQVIDNALDGLDMLKKMEDGTENPSKIPALTRSVDFSINESVAKVSAKISEQLAKSSLADFSSRMAQIMHNSGVDAISGADHLNPDSIQPQATTAPVQDQAARAVNDAKTKAIQTAAPTILKKGTDDEKLVFSLAGVANAESYAADLAKDVQSGTTDIGAVYTATAKDANAFDAGHYLIAKRTVAQYGDMQKQLAEMQAPRDQLVQQRDQAVEQMQGGIITDVDRTEEEIDGVTHVLTADYDAVNNKYIIHDSNPSDDEETKQAIADYDMWLRSNLNMENYAAGRRADLQVTVDNLTAQINVLNGDIERQETAIKGYQKLYDQAQDDIKTSQTKNQAVAMVDVLAKNPQVDFTTPEGQRELAEATARNASLASSIDLVMDIGSQYKPTQWSPDTVFQEMQSNGASQATMTQAANAIIAECDRDIAALTQAMDQMQAAGAQIPKEYTSNLNREMEKQQSRKQTAEDFLLQNNPDFTESVTDKTADVLRATADGKREYNSLTQDVASRLVGADNIPDAYFTSDARKNQYDAVASMREDELKTYMYKLDKKGETAAWEYFRSIQETLQVRSTIAQNEELADFAKEYPVLAAITSIGISPATTKAAGYTAVSLLSGQEINPYNRFFDSTWAANTLDQTAKETILAPLEEGSVLKKIAGIGYDAVTSGAKSLLNSALTAPFVGGSAFWGAVPMGLQAAGAAAQETKLSGGSDLQAAEMAGVTFLAETLSETITTQNISEAIDKGAKGVKAVMKKALGNDMVEEFVGEAANQAVESIADTAIMGSLSKRNQAIAEYEKTMSHEEAVKQADKDFWKGVLSAGITGALSAAGTTGAGYIGGRLSSIGTNTNTTTPTASGQARAYALENGLPLDYARNDQTARTLSMLTSALNANRSSQTMALGAALMPATGDQQSQNAAVSAGLRLADRFGPEQAISTMQQIMMDAEQDGIDQSAIKSAMTVAALGYGEAAQVLSEISETGTTGGDVQALIDAAGRDSLNPAITARMQAIIHNDRVSMRTRDLIGDGALNGVQPYAENVLQKQAEVEITAKNTEQEHDRLQAMGDNLKTLNDEHNAAPDNQAIAGKLTQATKDLTGQIKVAQEYDQSLEQKQQQLDDAQKQLDQVTNDAMTKTREQAMADVAAQEQAEAEAALAEATQAEAEAEAPASNPNVSTAYTNSQVPVSFHYALVPASDLITSNTDTYEANPAYPAELQPRDRTRAASQDQISGMVRSLNPARLGESADVQNGAPIVGTDNVVESGNARTMAIRQAMTNNPQSAARYTAWLRENAARFGLNPADVADNSVLVRVRDTDLDRAAFARAANESTTAGYSPSENAQTDADKLTPRMMELFAPADNGSLSNTDNHAFVLAFLNEIIPESERGAYMQQDGTISQQGYERIRNAVFQRAYGNTALTQALTEDTDGTAKNVMNALLKAAPRMMALQETVDQGAAYDVGLASKIAEAAQRYIELRNAGMDVETYLNQTAMPGIQTEDEGTQALMRLFEQYRRSGKKLAEALGNIADALEDAGDPRAMSFLGENTAPGLPELVRQGVARMDAQQSMFSAYRGNPNVSASLTPQQQAQQQQNSTNARPKRSPQRIAKNLLHDLGVGQFVGTRKMNNLPADVAGYYQHQARYVAVRNNQAGNYVVNMHEIGHALADRLGMTGTQAMVNNLDPVFAANYTPAELPGEAFAEFMWRYMESDAAGRAFAGDAFVDDFERAMQENGIARDVHRAATQLRAWVNASTSEQIGATIRERSDHPKLGFREQFRRIINGAIDASNAAEAVNHAIREQTGNREVPFDQDVRANSLLKNQAGNRAYYILTEGMTDSSWTRTGGDSLAQVFEHAGLTSKDVPMLESYMLALHSLDRDAQGKPVFDDHITPAARQAFIQDVQQNHPEVAAAEQGFQAWRKEFLQRFLVDTGYLSQEAFDKMNAMYPHYVPTMRVKDERYRSMNQEGGKRYQVRRATGSTEDIWSPMDTFVGMVDSIITMVSANNAALAWDNAYHNNDLGAFGREITPDRRQVTVNVENLQQQIADLLTGNVDDDVLQQAIDLIGTRQSQWVQQNGSSLPNVLTVQHPDGSRTYYEMADTELYKLLASVNEQAKSKWIKPIGLVTRGMSALTTGSNPVFAVRNFMRDFQNSVNYGSWASNYGSGVLKWLSSAYDVWRGNGAYQDYAALGGGGWTRIDSGTKKGAAEYRSGLYQGYNTENVGRTVKYAGQKLWNAITLARLNEVVEQTSRYAEYKYGQHDKSTAAGRAQAFQAAQEATVDFSRRGNSSVADGLRQIIPFFNASLQGVYRTGRSLTEAERGRAAARFTKTIVNTALMSALCNALLLKNSDDDEKKEFAMMSDELKAQHFYLPNFAPDILGQQPLIRIPLSQDPLTYAVHGAVTNAMWNGTTDEAVLDLSAIADTILDNLNPLGNGTIFQPLLGIGQNKNWYGSRIVPTRMADWDKSTQYTEETPDVFINAGRWVSGFAPDSNLASPLNLQYLAEQYTGFLGQMLIPAFSKDKNTGELGGVRAAITAAQKRLTSDPLVSNDIVSSFYDGASLLGKVTSAAKNERPMNMLRRGLSSEEASAAYEEAKEMTSSNGVIGKTKKAINDMYAEIDQINANPTLTDEQKYTLTSEKRREMMEVALEANEAIGAYKENYITGLNVANRALFEGATARISTAAEKIPQTFQADQDKQYMKWAKAVYDEGSEASALPHPDYTFSSRKVDYTVPEADQGAFDEKYKEAYISYLAIHSAGWDSKSYADRLEILKDAHSKAQKEAKDWYIQQPNK